TTWQKFSKWLCLYIMLAIPIFCELTNMLWHTGSYVEFPMRFGYILTFTGLSFMGSILQRGMDESQISEGEKAEKMKMRWLQYLRIPAIAAIPFIALALFYFMRQFTQSGIRDTSFYSSYWSIFAILIVTYAMALISKDKKVIVTVCSILVILQLGLGWYGFLAPENMFSIECTDSIVKNTESINDIFEEAADHRINRVKDNSVSLNANYPFILKQASISNWTLGAKPAFRRFMGKLGYSTDYTRILDNGGTLFSDAFLHVTNCISKEQLSSQLYSSIIEKNGYIYGETKYTYPFGLLVPETIKNLNGNEATSAFNLQNILFKLINQNEEDLIEIYDASSFLLSEGITENDTYQYVLQIPIQDKSVLYIENIQNEDPNFYTFYINGKNKTISALDYEENYVYPACFNNGIIDCGIYQNETVDFVIESLNPIIEGEITFGCLSLEKIQNSIAEQEAVERVVKANKNSLYMEVQNDHADYILIPIGYDSSTMVKVNGRKIISQTVADDAFYLIPLEKGKNVITMYFLPAGLKLGILISVIGILAFVGSWFWKEKIVSCKLVQSVMYILLNIMEKGIILLLYIIPILITIGVKIWFHFYLLKQ
ncbi:MAG: YfhO family protein, partial [Lachnospiraceae bacterium]